MYSYHIGWTALMDASMCGQADVVKLLLARGADKEMKNTNGFTALMLAPNKQIGIYRYSSIYLLYPQSNVSNLTEFISLTCTHS